MHTIKDNQQLSEKQYAKHVGLLYQLNYFEQIHTKLPFQSITKQQTAAMYWKQRQVTKVHQIYV